MNKRMNKQQTTPVTDTFKGMLLMSMGVPVGNIRPYRLKSAPSCLGGFERMSVAAARASGMDIPETEKRTMKFTYAAWDPPSSINGCLSGCSKPLSNRFPSRDAVTASEHLRKR